MSSQSGFSAGFQARKAASLRHCDLARRCCAFGLAVDIRPNFRRFNEILSDTVNPHFIKRFFQELIATPQIWHTDGRRGMGAQAFYEKLLYSILDGQQFVEVPSWHLSPRQTLKVREALNRIHE